MGKDLLRGLFSEIEKEIDNLKELKKQMSEIYKNDSLISKRATGSILHDFYNCCERIFKRIVIDINSGYEDSEKWHKNLLFKMTISIKDTRPSVISEELAAELDEYLSFRHVFRNFYGFELKGGRIGYLAGKFPKVVDMFINEITVFLGFIKKELDRNEEC